jgi:hypothetical protein
VTATLLMAAPAAAGFRRDVTRLRERRGAEAERIVRAHLEAQRRDVAARVGQGGKAVFTLWDAAQLVPEWHAARLRRALHNVYERALRETYEASLGHFGLRGRLTNEDVRGLVEQAGERLAGVTDTTRDAVRLALRQGLLDRDTPAQLAERLRGLPAFDAARASLVAETEVATVTNGAAMAAYTKDRRVRGVVVHDRERCAPQGGPCAGQDGRELSLEEAGTVPLLFHPRCSAMRSPVL